MKKAIWSGLLTMLGTILGIWGVFQGVRLDWAEAAIVASAGLFVAGFMVFARLMESVHGEEDEDVSY